MSENNINLILRKAEKVFGEEELIKKLKDEKKLKIKFGCDPSRPDLHLGHSVCLRLLKNLQDMGHEIIFVIGDFTAMIGDPSGKSKTRPALTFEETQENGKTYFEQVGKILDTSKIKIAYNSEWLGKMTFEDVLKLTSKYTVARILERDDFNNRFKNNMPIGIHEFMYPLMQGYDSVALNCDVEVGGTDQTFNLLVGRELQKDYGLESQSVMVFPLLIGLDGKEKMSKSLNNYIGISESADVMFEKAMRIPDELLFDYFKLTTDCNLDEVKKGIEKDIFNAHKIYAREIIKMYHGNNAIKDAEERYNSVAKGSIPDNINTIELSKKLLDINIVDLLIDVNLVSSKSEARRLIEQNGISVNQEKIQSIEKEITNVDLNDNFIIIQKGKKIFLKVIFE